MSENRLDWLHGWPRTGPFDVLMGTGLHCIACGRLRGIAAVSGDLSALPDRQPDWPFDEEGCPVCLAHGETEQSERQHRFAAGPAHKLP